MKISAEIIVAAVSAITALVSLFFSLRKESRQEAKERKDKEDKVRNKVLDIQNKLNRMREDVDKITSKTNTIKANCKAHEALSNTADIEELKTELREEISKINATISRVGDNAQNTREKLMERYVTREVHDKDMDNIKEYINAMAEQWKLADKLAEALKRRNGD